MSLFGLMAANQLGFSIPTVQSIVQVPRQENAELYEKKRKILTELAAIENDMSIFDIIDPARDNLPSSVTDVPCSVEFLSSPHYSAPHVNNSSASESLAELIVEIAKNPSSQPFCRPRPDPPCNAIIKHANKFFAQLKAANEARAGLLTAFCIIPRKHAENTGAPPPSQEKPAEEDTGPSKHPHPFFPDVKGIDPLLGLMKEQLGDFPNFIKNPPSPEECEESLWMMPEDAVHEHLLEICGSSSDDEFNPDEPITMVKSPAMVGYPGRV